MERERMPNAYIKITVAGFSLPRSVRQKQKTARRKRKTVFPEISYRQFKSRQRIPRIPLYCRLRTLIPSLYSIYCPSVLIGVRPLEPILTMPLGITVPLTKAIKLSISKPVGKVK